MVRLLLIIITTAATTYGVLSGVNFFKRKSQKTIEDYVDFSLSLRECIQKRRNPKFCYAVQRHKQLTDK